jgi:hypothetical protein
MASTSLSVLASSLRAKERRPKPERRFVTPGNTTCFVDAGHFSSTFHEGGRTFVISIEVSVEGPMFRFRRVLSVWCVARASGWAAAATAFYLVSALVAGPGTAEKTERRIVRTE